MATAQPIRTLLAQITAGIQSHDDNRGHTPDFVILNARYLPQLAEEYSQAMRGMPFCKCLPSTYPALWIPVEVSESGEDCILVSLDDGPLPIAFSPSMTTRNMEAQQA